MILRLCLDGRVPKKMNYNRPIFRPRGETEEQELRRATRYINEHGKQLRAGLHGPETREANWETMCARCKGLIQKGQDIRRWARGWCHDREEHCRANGWVHPADREA